ncbi:uncharacterized protein PHALS_04826 [Plasmopara halstedii]|uniref:Uncharacterized protein n=1 Tax=Plasmopara halstedii TaxID=4781 RepID=A0A0P1AZ79_PLAHL|nr:uncharacterized protein PHALS_04826 [Plasmopara halstedii]CEG47679.1 hypothetical protein PHALS_04826 [Plasmopara halstedii]|eukprot:XP_024584048.1 hypothetical protein PHALS_04826 [Plasmopara halstedii]
MRVYRFGRSPHSTVSLVSLLAPTECRQLTKNSCVLKDAFDTAMLPHEIGVANITGR